MNTARVSCCGIDETFDGQTARRDLERYRLKGPSPSTQQLLNAIRRASLSGDTVLDVGGGIGAIAHELLRTGAERASIVDASAAYLSAAREEAERRGVSARLQLLQGDFVALVDRVEPADVVTLDKVVCCYPDMDRLLAATTGRAGRLYAIVYPRDSWWVHLYAGAKNTLRRIRRSAFRLRIFAKAKIDAAIARAGFELRSRTRGLMWVVALYERRPGE